MHIVVGLSEDVILPLVTNIWKLHEQVIQSFSHGLFHGKFWYVLGSTISAVFRVRALHVTDLLVGHVLAKISCQER